MISCIAPHCPNVNKSLRAPRFHSGVDVFKGARVTQGPHEDTAGPYLDRDLFSYVHPHPLPSPNIAPRVLIWGEAAVLTQEK